VATVDKNFRVKHGLVVANNLEVQGTSLTVNGNEVLTTATNVSAVKLGTTYPTTGVSGDLFLNTSNGRMAVLDVNAWREIAYLTEIEPLFAGEADTTDAEFVGAYDGGTASTDIFIGAVDGGVSNSSFDTGGFTL
jgi:hypothetical protein